MKIIPFIVNSIHLIIMFTPFIIICIDTKYTKPFIHWILLMAILLPLHWVFFRNQCLLTLISKKAGGYPEYSDNEFTRANLKWLYYPIIKMFGMKWVKDDITKISIVHSIVNVTILWFYTFYISDRCK